MPSKLALHIGVTVKRRITQCSGQIGAIPRRSPWNRGITCAATVAGFSRGLYSVRYRLTTVRSHFTLCVPPPEPEVQKPSR
jgi:hypothetical protein